MPGMNYAALQSLATDLITRFGGGSADNASLRRAGVDRPCTVVILSFTNRERQSEPLLQYTDKKVLIAASGLDVPPNYELDTIVLSGVNHRIIMPATPLAPDGTTVVFWEVAARK